MFLKLHLTPIPDFDDALCALESARAVCARAGVPAIIARRDYVALEYWYAGAHLDGMVSDDEVAAAMVWADALAAARHALRLPSHVRMDIEVLTAGPFMAIPIVHGPDRLTWRRNWARSLEGESKASLGRTQMHRPTDGQGTSEY